MENLLNKQIGKKSKTSIQQNIWVSLLIGILIGWAVTFVLICFIIGGSINEIFSMDEIAFRTILFISFPMGAILGTAFVLVKKKIQKDKEHQNIEKSSTTKDVVSKLKEFKQLLDSGVLTQAEFDKQKEKILNEQK